MKEFNFDIWRLQTQSNVRGLIDAIKSSDPTLRQKAAMALRVMGSGSALPALQDALLTETDKETRDIIIVTLESLFSQEHEDDTMPDRTGSQVVEFIARLNSSNTEHAIRAAQGLGDIQEKLAVEALIMTFNNRQLAARVRLAAAEALIRLQSATADMSLLAALRSERWSVRRSAAAVLGQMDADWAVEPLIKALQDSYEVVRRAAHSALENINTPEARHALQANHELAGSLPKSSSSDSDTDAMLVESPAASITSAQPPAVTETRSEAQLVIKPAVTVIEPTQAATSLTVTPVASPPVMPVPEARTNLRVTVQEPSKSFPDPLSASPASSVATTVTASDVLFSSAGTVIPAPSPSVNLEPASPLPPPTEEDTRPMTPVPDDVS